MRNTIVRVGATGAGVVLALGLLGAPAGAAGKDEQKAEQSSKVICFDPEGKTQGRSLSDPDGTSNGGADKPGCTGGFDADKDGNNGCGNDADREDDNNGNCGGKKTGDTGTAVDEENEDEGTVEEVVADVNVQTAGPISATGAAAEEPSTTATDPTTVSGSSVVAPDVAETTTSPAAPDTQVLGATLSAPDLLARTGAGIGGLALLGGALIGGGRLTVLARKLLRIG